jgi:hypothetical protein
LFVILRLIFLTELCTAFSLLPLRSDAHWIYELNGSQQMKYVIGNQTYHGKGADVSAALEKAHTIAWPGQIEEGQTIFIFNNDSDLRAWARSAPSPIAEQIEKTNELTRKAQEQENADNERSIFWQSLLIKRVMSDIQSLADQFGLDPFSERLFKIAFEGDSVLEPSVLRSAILFDRAVQIGAETRCEGAWRPIPAGVAFPNLSWIRFDDRASSVRVHGSLMLTKHRWFRGPSVFLSGWPLPCKTLADVNFHNAASSAVSL